MVGLIACNLVLFTLLSAAPSSAYVPTEVDHRVAVAYYDEGTDTITIVQAPWANVEE